LGAGAREGEDEGRWSWVSESGHCFDVSLCVNGRDVRAKVPATRTLLDFLRDDLGLTGAKEGCGKGECGACTVLVDGKPVNSCLMLAYQADGRRVETIEGLEHDGRLHPIQEAFVSEGAVQCGFCTPGMIMSAKALLDSNPNPTREEVLRAISGNLCRCTGYAKIIKAIEVAAARLRMARGVEESGRSAADGALKEAEGCAGPSPE
jgi:carbon-monoxide dehydrogenase small subunit